MDAGTEAPQPLPRPGRVANNWLPVAGVGSLFLGGAVAAVVFDGDTRRTAAYFVLSTLVLILLIAPWAVRHPPAIGADPGSYLVLAVVVELGALLGGAVEAFHGLGAWVVLGIGLAVYGHLERGRVMVTAGVAAALTGVVAIAAARPWLTPALALATAALIMFAAWRLLASAGGPSGAGAGAGGSRADGTRAAGDPASSDRAGRGD